MDFRKTFDKIPVIFDKYRPRYCDELFEELIIRCELNSNKTVLEIGPDTGQATEPVLKTHCEHITLEEPYKTHFYNGIRDAFMKCGNKIKIINTISLYLVQKPK